MADSVNLDALVPREDFLAMEGSDSGSAGKTSASRTDLLKGESFFLTLRKPDFQRETAAWKPEAVRDFIKAFIDGDLIPAVICWQSPSRLSFVIDGAHRLSAIIAWLNDDYGDGEASIKFYNNNIQEEQRKLAQKTRDLINDSIGSYKDHKAETENPNSNPKLTAQARALAHSVIPLLWVTGTDSSKAERAFLNINQAAVQIDPTELKILKDRFKPNAIAARAIVRDANGYKYWKDFSDKAQKQIETTAKEIYKAFYKPPLQSPIRTQDLPIAGYGYGSQTLPLIFDFINISNDIQVIDASKKSRKVDMKLSEQTKATEQEVVRAIENTDKLARRLTGDHASSLGLHPAIYFYSANGRHQPTAVLAMALLAKEFSDRNELDVFTKHRKDFENFLVEHKIYINQLTVAHGSMAKGFRPIRDYFRYVFEAFRDNKTAAQVTELLSKHDRYQKLVKGRPQLAIKPKEFSKETKQLKFLTDALAASLICGICGARIDHKAMHLDHKIDKSLGGLATSDNAQWAHPYCNSTYKYTL